MGATVGHAENSGDLRRLIEEGKKIVITTVQKFPFILDEIGNEQRGRNFANRSDSLSLSYADLNKSQINSAWSAPLPSALDDEAAFQARAFATEDLREGAAAFVEKRPPRFTR